MSTGKFIVLEGIDGSGTTTQVQKLANYLFEKDKRNAVLMTREPTKLSPYGIELRRRLAGNLEPGENVINDPAYWADLFINDRRWHLDTVIVPVVKAGLQVISDRHKLSTIAYQSAQGADMDELIRKHERMYSPNLTLLLNVSADVAAGRMQSGRAGGQEYFDALELQRRIAQNYILAAAKMNPLEKIIVIDGSKPIDEVALAIKEEINVLYGYI